MTLPGHLGWGGVLGARCGPGCINVLPRLGWSGLRCLVSCRSAAAALLRLVRRLGRTGGAVAQELIEHRNMELQRL
jgi:hypothetical protein